MYLSTTLPTRGENEDSSENNKRRVGAKLRKAKSWFTVPAAVVELKNDANKDSRSPYANMGSLQLDYYCLYETAIAVKMKLFLISLY